MIVCRTLSEIHTQLQGHDSIGFVPTMGALHQGHLQIIERARSENDLVVVSLFINPTQFNDPKDFEKYPRTVERDLQLLEEQAVDLVFLPTPEVMYPNGNHYQVLEDQFSLELCGQSRPGHFSGMLTVVLKLLNIVAPDRAYFGEKDFQQLELIRGMVQDFFLNVEIIAHPTVRDEQGLALSSRNQRLSELGLETAHKFAQALREHNLEAVQRDLSQLPLKVDYLVEKNGRLFAAVFVEDVRLIDNVPL